MEPFSILVLVVLVLALVLVFQGVRAVPQGEEHTVERFGRYTGTLRPGLNLIVPLVDRVGRRLNMMEQVLDVPSQEVITRDNAMVKVDGVVFFQVLDAAKAAYEITNLHIAIMNLTMTNIRTVIGSMDLDELLSKRDEINARLLAGRRRGDRAVGREGHPHRDQGHHAAARPDRVAWARQMKAERDKRAKVLQAEGERQAAILRAEGSKQAVILEADGRREAAYRDAEARERLAQAEAAAAAMLSKALAEGSAQAVNYFVAQRYLDALTAFARSPNQKTLILPIEATGILGSLAGIGELAREAFGRDRPGGEPRGPWGPAPAAEP